MPLITYMLYHNQKQIRASVSSGHKNTLTCREEWMILSNSQKPQLTYFRKKYFLASNLYPQFLT